jgi:hypothetical protein
MPQIITYDDVTAAGQHDRFCLCASDIGLRAGQWPETLETSIGNALPLKRIRVEGDGVLYRQACGSVELLVFND